MGVGIGNRTILTRAGVRPLLDLPGVGENFQVCNIFASICSPKLIKDYVSQEHPFVGVEFKLRTGHQTFGNAASLYITEQSLILMSRYLE